MKTVSPPEYYNQIANEYDQLLKTDKDQFIRNFVEKYFKENCMPGVILDFGSGTGLDLVWLIECSTEIYCYEPSINMLSVAKQNYSKLNYQNKITFLNQSPFERKSAKDIFNVKVDSILLNFGVINYIENLDGLFYSFAKVSSSQSNLIINLLFNPNKSLIQKFKQKAMTLFLSKKGTLKIKHNNTSHSTYLYSPKDIVKASGPHFELVHKEVIGGNLDFTLLHFKKK